MLPAVKLYPPERLAESLSITPTTPLAGFGVPLTVRLKAEPPAVVKLGFNPVVVGTGFGLLIVKVWAFEVPPPGVGLNTVTLAVPAAALSAAAIGGAHRGA